MYSSIKKLPALILAAFSVLMVPAALSAVPDGIDYQAYLTDSTGAPIDGDISITFAAYNVPVDGVPLWSQALTVPVDQGLFSVTLGNPVQPFPSGLFDGPVYIGLFVAGEALMPRRALNSTAYSFKSADADTLTGATAADLDESAEVANNAADIASLSGDISGFDVRITTLEATDITAVNAGAGLTGGGSSGNVAVGIAAGGVNGSMIAPNSISTAQIIDGQVGINDLASNSVGSNEIVDGAVGSNELNNFAAFTMGGLTVNGTLVNNVSAGNATFNLTSTSDFVIQDAGTNVFSVEDNGRINIGDDMFWRDLDTGGLVVADLIDDGNDGLFRLYEDGVVSILLDANGTSVFNQQGLSRDFRVESVTNSFAFFVDASENNVGIGTSSLDRNFHVRHDQFTGAGGFGGIEIENSFNTAEWTLYTSQSTSNLALYFEGNLRGEFNDVTGAYAVLSDRRLKKDIQRIESSLGGILKLKPSLYRFKEQNASESLSAGFLAQEVKEVFPEAVHVRSDDTNGHGLSDPHMMESDALIPHLVRAVQEQQAVIERLEERIAELEER